MPKKKLWHETLRDGVCINHGGTLLTKYGNVVKIKPANKEDGDKFIKVCCSHTMSKPNISPLFFI